MRRLSALVAILAATACASAPRPTLEPLRDAASSVERGAGDARALALAGWQALFEGGDAERAVGLADRAVEAAPADPWARFLRADLARRSLDPKAEAAELLALVQGAPAHPLALVAAGRLAIFPRRAPELDAMLDEGLRALLDSDAVRGEVRTRLRGALRVMRAGEGLDAIAPLVGESGLLTAGSVVGPFSDWHALEATKAFGPEADAPLAAAYGERSLRPFAFPTGSISLQGEESDGDIYYVLSMVDVPRGGSYAVRLATASSTTAAVIIDGRQVVERRGFAGPASSQAVQAIDLAAGSHLVAVRLVRGRGPGNAWVALAPLDGSPATVEFRAAQPGDRPGKAPALIDSQALRSGNDATLLAADLVAEGGVVGIYAAALDAARRDEQNARALVDRALRHAPEATPLLALRAELVSGDGSLPSRIATARAGSDWEAVLAHDPGHGMALLAGAGILAEAGRHDDALERLGQVETAAPGSTAPLLARARVALARGFEADALELGRRLSAAGSDRCAGWSIVYDLSRRVDAVADVDAAASALVDCGDGRPRLASVHTSRGATDEAIRLAEALLAEDPQSGGAAHRLADLLVSVGRIEGAVRILEQQEAFWPRNAWLPRRRAELLERMGDGPGATAARARSLALNGGDLGLRRMAALEAGGDLLDEVKRDGLEVVRRFQAQGTRSFDSPAVLLLDLGAIEVYPDGSYVEKIHIIARVLDKRGIDEFGEAHLPQGAEVIQLRTIKPDGSFLVPETIHGKDSISMPGLSVGDYVEQAYLVAHPARAPALQGWSAAPFFFRTAGVPMLESVYVVRAHEDAGLVLDVHNGMEGAALAQDGPWRTLTLRRTDVPALVPEPVAPARREYLPWAQVGAGADESALFAFFADNLAAVAAPTLDVQVWAEDVVASAPDDRSTWVRALYDRAMAEIEGSERSFRDTAAHVLASRRGNRLVLLKAALDSLGFETRYASIRTFEQDPDSYRFPEANRWGYIALVVRTTPGGAWTWLDPGIRWAPFGQLAPHAQGLTAWILPAPGETAAQRTTTPEQTGTRGREVELRLALDEAGTLTGEGVERYLGHEGAAARGSLEKMDADRLEKVIEGSLARAFPGLTLASVELANIEDGVEVRYAFEQPGAVRELGEGRKLLRLDVFQADLGRRYLARGVRETPLLVATPERARVSVQLELPPGAEVESGVEAAREHGRFGDYKRAVAVDGTTVGIREELDLERGRIAPDAYADFAAWVAAVDRAQQVELTIAR